MDSSEEWDIAVCGLNCARCGIHQAYNKKDRDWQIRMAKAIFGEDTKIDPDSITCDRCRGSLDRHWSGDCKLRICAEERGYRYCFQCDDFVCKKLVEFSKTHHGRTVDNMKEMKKIGLYNWLKKQKKKGQAVMCP